MLNVSLGYPKQIVET